jgi:hypothetical protein
MPFIPFCMKPFAGLVKTNFQIDTKIYGNHAMVIEVGNHLE